MRSRIEPMKKVARTLRTHRDLILNYFRARKEFSSGVIEGLNNKAKVTMRKSYGFRTFRVTELALYHSLASCLSRNSPTDFSDESKFLATAFAFGSLAICPVWAAEDYYAGGIAGFATLSADGRSILSSTTSQISL